MEQPEPQLTDEEYAELEAQAEEEALDNAEDATEDNFQNNQALQEAYGYPQPDERFNQHTFLDKATFKTGDTTKTTFLDQYELGRASFSVRWLLDIEDLAKFYMDDTCKTLDVPNKLAEYFHSKIINVTDSGMSKDGFSMNLNVTKKMDTTRVRGNPNAIENLKGGKKR